MNRIGAFIVLGSVMLSGCQAPPSSSITPLAPSEPAAAALHVPSAGMPSGVFEGWVPNYDGRLGPVRVMIQIGPTSSSCQNSVFVLPMAQSKTRFNSEVYYAPVTVSRYALRRGRAYVVASAKLGSDLGTLRVEGLVGSKSFQLFYRDRRGGGTMTTGYIQPCKPLHLRTGNPTAQKFLGTWRVALGESTFGLPFGEQSATINITTSECLTAGCDGVRLVGQVTRTDSGSLPLMKTPLPYCVRGIWTYTGFWSMEVDAITEKDGSCTPKRGAGEVDWGTEHWFPPGGDRTIGAWAALHDPYDDNAATGGPFAIVGR